MKKNNNSKQSNKSITNKKNSSITNCNKSKQIKNQKNVGFATDNADSFKLDPDNDNSFTIQDCD